MRFSTLSAEAMRAYPGLYDNVVYAVPTIKNSKNYDAFKRHNKGDILVVSNDGQSVSTINNEVFALTFNQNIGGWAQSRSIMEPTKIKPITLDFVKHNYNFY